MERTLLLTLLGAAIISSSACIKSPGARMEKPLMNLTTAVRGAAAYAPDNALQSDKEALHLTYQRNPELERTFHGYPVQIRHEGKEVVVLVCSRNGKFALLEDASWTEPVDRRWYKFTAKPKEPCLPDHSLVPGGD
jgi:hypothetical protein